MIIGIVDDDFAKRQTILSIVTRCGGDATILQCGSLSAVRHMLRDTALALLILDIALPEHEDSGEPLA
jgi:response regulator of citrate/malate metabolism